MDPIGYIAEYIEKNRLILAMVQTNKKGRLGVLTTMDRQAALPQNRALLFTPAAIGPDRPRDALVAYLRELEEKREGLAGEVDVPELWELVHEEDEPLPLSDLAELIFGKPVEDDHLSAILRALFNERLHFRLAGKEFLPLGAEQLEQKILTQQKEAEHRAEVDAAVEYLKNLPPEGATGEVPPAPPGLLELLRDLVVLEEDAPEAKKAKEILALAEIGGRKRLFKLLAGLGVFSPHENLAMLKQGIEPEFSPRIMECVQEIKPPDGPVPGREDLTDLYTFTIDGPFTTDFDDALSFEPDHQAGLGAGVLGVHITDAASLLTAPGPLEDEARFRATTLYMPDARVPMLPPELSEDALSLREDQLRPAISFMARLDKNGGLHEPRLCRSMIRVHKRLTYDQADEILASDNRLAGLHAACLNLRDIRAAKGAYFLPLPEVLIRVDENYEVAVRRVDREGPSREMVAETAIFANRLAAEYLLEMGAPALFRTQSPPSQPFEEGPAQDIYLHFRQRRLLNRVEITTKPGLHSSLGVEPYTHVTSPIRRYLDLVMQRQLGAVLAGKEPLYSAEELRNLTMEVEPSVRRSMRVRQARQRYWLLRWLWARRSESLPAIVMEYQLRRWQLLLTDIMMLTTIPSTPGLSLEPGQPVGVKVERADAFNDILRVSLAE